MSLRNWLRSFAPSVLSVGTTGIGQQHDIAAHELPLTEQHPAGVEPRDDARLAPLARRRNLLVDDGLGLERHSPHTRLTLPRSPGSLLTATTVALGKKLNSEALAQV